MRITLLFVMMLAASAAAQNGAVDPSPAAEAVVARFDADTAGARTRLAKVSPDMGIARNLAERVAVDQALRTALPDLAASGLSSRERQAANTAIWRRIAPVDQLNTAYVKSVLPADGWFRKSRDGEQVTRDAWLIVQHSPDRAFQREVAGRMAGLVKAGEVNGPDYALLFDRVEMFAGRPQRYGSQVECRGGRYVPAAMQDPANVDARRASVGLGPMATYMKNFAGGC